MGYSFFFKLVSIFLLIEGMKGELPDQAPYDDNDPYQPFWDEMHITWCPPPYNQSEFCFQRMPKTAYEAEKLGWRLISQDCSNHGRYSGFIYIYQNDYSMSLIYDNYGYIAGVQTNMPEKELTSCPHLRYLYDFMSVPYFVINRYNGTDYLTLTAYIVDPKTICGKGRTIPEYDYEGLGNGLWLQNGDACDFYQESVPTFREAAIQKYWNPTRCVDAMGFHNFKNMYEWGLDYCTTVPPWGLLYDQEFYGNMRGFIFMVFGTAASENNRYEYLDASIVEWVMGGENCPRCVKPSILNCGFTTMHVYLTRNPSAFRCPM